MTALTEFEEISDQVTSVLFTVTVPAGVSVAFVNAVAYVVVLQVKAIEWIYRPAVAVKTNFAPE